MSDLTNSLKNSGAATAPKASNQTSQNATDALGLSNPALWYSGGFIALFVTLALFDGELLSSVVNAGFAWSVKVFGPYWQLLLLLTFLIGLGLAAGRTGKVILGNIAKPEMNSFRWMVSSSVPCLPEAAYFGQQQNRSRTLSALHHFMVRRRAFSRLRLTHYLNPLCTGASWLGQLSVA